MKLLLRSIILLAFCFMNGYDAHAALIRSGDESAVTFTLSRQQASAYRLQQADFNSGHLPAHPRKIFRKTRATREDDDDESKFSCLKKARDGDLHLYSVACSFRNNAIASDASSLQPVTVNHPAYSFPPFYFPHKLYRLFCIFRI